MAGGRILHDCSFGAARALLVCCDEEAAAALLADPRKTALAKPLAKLDGQPKSIDVPRGDDGKYLYWAPPMSLCDCGTPDGGHHIKFKWPCAYYRSRSPLWCERPCTGASRSPLWCERPCTGHETLRAYTYIEYYDCARTLPILYYFYSYAVYSARYPKVVVGFG